LEAVRANVGAGVGVDAEVETGGLAFSFVGEGREGPFPGNDKRAVSKKTGR